MTTKKTSKAAPTKEVESQKEEEPQRCGLIMPISSLGECSEQHWVDVKSILADAIDAAGFKANLVSDADDVGIIQKRIIQNIYDNPIVVCDVSGKNPNVMFELGLRLAFDKPTIIVKDDVTSYSFDTAPIEHLEYPRDLRFNKIIAFKKALKEKIEATYKKATEDPSYTTFLKHFGKFHVAQIETTEVSKDDYIIEELRDLRRLVTRKDRRDPIESRRSSDISVNDLLYSEDAIKDLEEAYRKSLKHFLAEGTRIIFPEMENDIAEHIIDNSSATKHFTTEGEFKDCLKNIIYSR